MHHVVLCYAQPFWDTTVSYHIQSALQKHPEDQIKSHETKFCAAVRLSFACVAGLEVRRRQAFTLHEFSKCSFPAGAWQENEKMAIEKTGKQRPNPRTANLASRSFLVLCQSTDFISSPAFFLGHLEAKKPKLSVEAAKVPSFIQSWRFFIDFAMGYGEIAGCLFWTGWTGEPSNLVTLIDVIWFGISIFRRSVSAPVE